MGKTHTGFAVGSSEIVGMRWLLAVVTTVTEPDLVLVAAMRVAVRKTDVVEVTGRAVEAEMKRICLGCVGQCRRILMRCVVVDRGSRTVVASVGMIRGAMVLRHTAWGAHA